jgi:hypothetical protein|tara:strand:+ start:5961 stop:6299 length:339 start_codon:yes stop_codon:yes gene_type:complete
MINEFKIGSFVVKGKRYLGDIKIIQGRARYWQDRYKQQLREEDIQDILAKNPEVIIIGKGCNGLLEISEELERTLKRSCKELLIQKTPEAVETFNTLSKEGIDVAAIFHATG